jgi:predicted Rdx family selenoprotein
LAAKLKHAFGVEPTLVRGASGIFDVCVDGKIVYSKFETHEFPDEDALVTQLLVETKR